MIQAEVVVERLSLDRLLAYIRYVAIADAANPVF
jgi:hypothetical protein